MSKRGETWMTSGECRQKGWNDDKLEKYIRCIIKIYQTTE